MNIWSELKRRNVIRVGAAYLVASWVLIEVGSVMFDAFGFPDFAIKLLIAGLALGLLPVLVLAWAYELTPEGVVRDTGSGRENPEHRNTARRLDQVTIAMILIALGVVAVNRFVIPERVRPALTEQATPATAGQAVTSAAKPENIPQGPSIAVLPFANMSPDPDNEYFADGISEEILNVLASVDGLKVASRTSAFTFRDSNSSVAEIAAALGVANILEGSVRKQGNRVRITAQLIDAQTDVHRWSESYDRDLDDIFAVQEEIAQSITQALSDTLGITSVSVTAPTGNLDAYQNFLRGRTLFYQRGQSLIPARELLEQAVAQDPEFAEAWAVLAATIIVTPSYIPMSSEQAIKSARLAAERALALNASLPIPYAVLGLLEDFNRDFIASEDLFDQAIELDPDNSTPWLWRGLLHLGIGHFAAAEQDIQRAYSLDPLVGINNGWLGIVKVMRGDLDEAETYLKRTVELGWGPVVYFGLAALAYRRGQPEQEFEYLLQNRRASATGSPSSEAVSDAWIAALQDAKKIPAFKDAVVADVADNPENRWGLQFLWLGEFDAGLRHELDRPVVSASYFHWQFWLPKLRQAVESPVFMEYARRRGMLDYWRTRGYPDRCIYRDKPQPRLECDW